MLKENVRVCPSVDCEGFMVGSRLKPKLTCPECAPAIRFNCSQRWHGYLAKCASAQEAQDATEAERKYVEWAQSKGSGLKKCPKCKMSIEKNEGCNHMTCVSCKYDFCWLCRGKYTHNHFAQWNIMGCPGAQFNSSWLSIHRCPRCMPMCCRRVLIVLCFMLSLLVLLAAVPPVMFLGCIVGLLYGLFHCLDL